MSKTGLLGDYLSLFFLTVSNPITVVVFMAVFAGMSVFGESSSFVGELLVVIGVLLGGGVWWYTLSTLVNIFRKKFRLRVLITINLGFRVDNYYLRSTSNFGCFRSF